MLIRQRQLRWPVPEELPDAVLGHQLISINRRGKYLLLEFDPGHLIVHLGMSGSIRAVEPDSLWRTHDHIQWLFDNQTCLRLHDPRRFGAVLWHPRESGPILEHPLLQKLGVEPLEDDFTPETLLSAFKRKKTNIKQALLEGKTVVGVGNIYASESLFLARINPELPACELTWQQAVRLHKAIRDTLQNALDSGGSTLRDYVNATGEPGAYFELHAAVYEKEGHPCRICGTAIRRIVQGARATYFCPKCQPLKRKRPSQG